jgi:hypothetical protein
LSEARGIVAATGFPLQIFPFFCFVDDDVFSASFGKGRRPQALSLARSTLDN